MKSGAREGTLGERHTYTVTLERRMQKNKLDSLQAAVDPANKPGKEVRDSGRRASWDLSHSADCCLVMKLLVIPPNRDAAD